MDDAPGLSASTLCPYAASVTCNSQSDNYEPYFIAQGCRRYACQVCGPRRRAALARRIVTGHPNRMVTLTCRHELGAKHQLKIMRTNTSKFISTLRKRFGDIQYVRILETCKDGYPHFHYLMRSTYLPQAELKAIWTKLTGATIVDVRKAHGRSVSYVAKYISKATGEDGTFSRQKIAVSRHFWEPLQGATEFCNFDHVRTHPVDFVEARYADHALERIRFGLYHVTEREPGDDVPYELTRTHNHDDAEHDIPL